MVLHIWINKKIVSIDVDGKVKTKRKYRRRPLPSEERRSARLELKRRRELQEMMVTGHMDDDNDVDGFASDGSADADVAGPAATRSRRAAFSDGPSEIKLESASKLGAGSPEMRRRGLPAASDPVEASGRSPSGVLESAISSQAEPMTLMLSPPAVSSGVVPQPAGVLLLPLYSSRPPEPGASLVVVQPQDLFALTNNAPGSTG